MRGISLFPLWQIQVMMMVLVASSAVVSEGSAAFSSSLERSPLCGTWHLHFSASPSFQWHKHSNTHTCPPSGMQGGTQWHTSSMLPSIDSTADGPPDFSNIYLGNSWPSFSGSESGPLSTASPSSSLGGSHTHSIFSCWPLSQQPHRSLHNCELLAGSHSHHNACSLPCILALLCCCIN